MNTKDNRRVRFTKKLLKETLMEMLIIEDIRKISISSICEKADVNRSTFYKYYSSQYDLLKDAETDIIEFIKHGVADIDTYSGLDYITNIITVIKNNKPLSNLLTNDNFGNDFKRRIFDVPIIIEKLRSNINGYSDEEFVYIQEFILSGMYSILKRWIDNDFPETPEEIALLIQKILLSFA